MPDDWQSPTGHNDPETQWTNPTNAYDNDEGTSAVDNIAATSWGDWLELTIAALNCNKVRFYATYSGLGIDEIDLEVYYSGAWHGVYQGSYASNEWVEKALGGIYSVTQARVKFHNAAAWAVDTYFFEFDFNQVIGAAVTEAFTAAETLSRFRTTGLSVSENLTSAEALAKQTVFNTPAVSENLTTAEALARTVESTKALAEAFAAGEAYKDTSVPWYDSNWAHRIDLTIDHDLVGVTQKLASDAASGQKDIVVQNGAAYAADDSIVIKDSSNRETGTVASVAGNTVTLVDNLAAAYTTANKAFLKNVTDSTDLTDFPCMFNEHSLPTHFWENVKADGTDVVLTTSDGTTKMKRELVAGSWSRANHKAEIHGKAPTASTTADTLVWLYYGYAAASETNDTDTWDEWFEAVYHMNDDPDTSHIKDSTSNGNDGTKKGANEPLEVAGTVGRAQDFDGGDDFINCGDLSLSLSAVTIEGVISADISDEDIFLSGSGSNCYGAIQSAIAIRLRHAQIGDGATQLAYAINNGQVYYYSATWDGADTAVYMDGAYVGGEPATGTMTIGTTHLGQHTTGVWKFNGKIDEVRLSSTNREGSWISTTHNTLMSPATFYSVGSVQHYTGLAAIVSFYTSILSENLTQAEALGVQASYQVSKAEALTAAETLARMVESTKAITEAMTTDETLARMVSSGKVLTEGLTASEALARTVTSTKVIAEALSIADTSVANLALYLLTLQLLARALTMQKPATSLTVKLHDRDYTATMEA